MTLGSAPKFNRDEMKSDIKDISKKYGKDAAKGAFNHVKDTEGFKESENQRIEDRDNKDKAYLDKLAEEEDRKRAERMAELSARYDLKPKEETVKDSPKNEENVKTESNEIPVVESNNSQEEKKGDENLNDPSKNNENSELEKQQKIELLKEEIAKQYQELKDIEQRKAEHENELNKIKEDKGYFKKESLLSDNSKFYGERIKKELFANKQSGINYLNKLAEVSINEPERYKQDLQNVINDFDNKKADFESGRDTLGTGVWNLLNKYADKLNNSTIGDLVNSDSFNKKQRVDLQENIEKDTDLSEATNRHKLYNELNNPTLKEIEIKNNLAELKKQAKDLGYNDIL
ncbi:MAG: hypothetical protein WCO35_00435 [Candidatus Nomurabacteria bacterium]